LNSVGIQNGISWLNSPAPCQRFAMVLAEHHA
jgi:hypothetical protein